MPSAPRSANLTEAVALLERAIGYGRAALGGVTDDLLSRPTPCRGWDLTALLAHMEDSLAAMAEAAEFGDVGLAPVCAAGGTGGTGAARLEGPPDAVVRLRNRACALLGAWTARASPSGEPAPGPLWDGEGSSAPPPTGQCPTAQTALGEYPVGECSVGGQPVPADLLVHAGALEIAVHAWDVTRACGLDRPLPAGLADRLLALAPTLVAAEDRPLRFGPVVTVLPQAGAAERLLAYLGRRV